MPKKNFADDGSRFRNAASRSEGGTTGRGVQPSKTAAAEGGDGGGSAAVSGEEKFFFLNMIPIFFFVLSSSNSVFFFFLCLHIFSLVICLNRDLILNL